MASFALNRVPGEFKKPQKLRNAHDISRNEKNRGVCFK